MKDIRHWLAEVERAGQLKRVEQADPYLEVGILTEINCRRRGPALLFDKLKGYPPGHRMITGALLNARRTGLTLGFPEVQTDQELLAALEGKFTRWEQDARDFPPEEVADGPVLEHRYFGDQVDLRPFPAPQWHEHDGGRYLGTGCAVITRDPDAGTVNLGTYRMMVQDEKTLSLHISSAHHGAINLRKYHQRGEAAPVAVSFGHHPLLLILGGLSFPYGTSEYEMAGAITRDPVSVVRGEVTGLPIPADSELVIEGFCPPSGGREEGPFGEYTGYYASGRATEPILEVKAVYHRSNPVILGAQPGRPPHDYSYFMVATKSAAVKDALTRDGIPEVKGVWYHEVAAVNFFAVVSIRQRYPGHARQAAYVAAQCRAGGTSLGRYVVVVDEDIDPTNLEEVVWAISTRTNPERDIDILRNTYTSPLDPVYPIHERAMFGSRAIIDACKPYDWIDRFPKVAQSSQEARERVWEKWKSLFDGTD